MLLRLTKVGYIYNSASEYVNMMQKYAQFISCYFRFKCFFFTVKLLLLLLLLLRYVTIEIVLTKTTVLILFKELISALHNASFTHNLFRL